MSSRNVLAHAIAPVLRLTGFRFDKSYRHADCGWKAIVYRVVSTVGANTVADGQVWPW